MKAHTWLKIGDVCLKAALVTTVGAFIGGLISEEAVRPFVLYVVVLNILGLASSWALYEFGEKLEFFEKIGVRPPSKNDWQAMKLVQQLVDAKAATIRARRDDLFAEEDGIVKIGKVTPSNFADKLARARRIQPEVAAIKKEWEEFKEAMKTRGFKVSEK